MRHDHAAFLSIMVTLDNTLYQVLKHIAAVTDREIELEETKCMIVSNPSCDLTAVFEKLDANCSQVLTIRDLFRFLSAFDGLFSDEEVNILISRFGEQPTRSGIIRLSDFLSTVLPFDSSLKNLAHQRSLVKPRLNPTNNVMKSVASFFFQEIETYKAHQSHCYALSEVSVNNIHSIINRLSKGKMSISFDYLLSLLRPLHPEITSNSLQLLFNRYDSNKDGTLEFTDLLDILLPAENVLEVLEMNEIEQKVGGAVVHSTSSSSSFVNQQMLREPNMIAASERPNAIAVSSIELQSVKNVNSLGAINNQNSAYHCIPTTTIHISNQMQKKNYNTSATNEIQQTKSSSSSFNRPHFSSSLSKMEPPPAAPLPPSHRPSGSAFAVENPIEENHAENHYYKKDIHHHHAGNPRNTSSFPQNERQNQSHEIHQQPSLVTHLSTSRQEQNSSILAESSSRGQFELNVSATGRAPSVEAFSKPFISRNDDTRANIDGQSHREQVSQVPRISAASNDHAGSSGRQSTVQQQVWQPREVLLYPCKHNESSATVLQVSSTGAFLPTNNNRANFRSELGHDEEEAASYKFNPAFSSREGNKDDVFVKNKQEASIRKDGSTSNIDKELSTNNQPLSSLPIEHVQRVVVNPRFDSDSEYHLNSKSKFISYEGTGGVLNGPLASEDIPNNHQSSTSLPTPNTPFRMKRAKPRNAPEMIVGPVSMDPLFSSPSPSSQGGVTQHLSFGSPTLTKRIINSIHHTNSIRREGQADEKSNYGGGLSISKDNFSSPSFLDVSRMRAHLERLRARQDSELVVNHTLMAQNSNLNNFDSEYHQQMNRLDVDVDVKDEKNPNATVLTILSNQLNDDVKTHIPNSTFNNSISQYHASIQPYSLLNEENDHCEHDSNINFHLKNSVTISTHAIRPPPPRFVVEHPSIVAHAAANFASSVSNIPHHEQMQNVLMRFNAAESVNDRINRRALVCSAVRRPPTANTSPFMNDPDVFTSPFSRNSDGDSLERKMSPFPLGAVTSEPFPSSRWMAATGEFTASPSGGFADRSPYHNNIPANYDSKTPNNNNRLLSIPSPHLTEIALLLKDNIQVSAYLASAREALTLHPAFTLQVAEELVNAAALSSVTPSVLKASLAALGVKATDAETLLVLYRCQTATVGGFSRNERISTLSSNPASSHCPPSRVSYSRRNEYGRILSPSLNSNGAILSSSLVELLLPIHSSELLLLLRDRNTEALNPPITTDVKGSKFNSTSSFSLQKKNGGDQLEILKDNLGRPVLKVKLESPSLVNSHFPSLGGETKKELTPNATPEKIKNRNSSLLIHNQQDHHQLQSISALKEDMVALAGKVFSLVIEEEICLERMKRFLYDHDYSCQDLFNLLDNRTRCGVISISDVEKWLKEINPFQLHKSKHDYIPQHTQQLEILRGSPSGVNSVITVESIQLKDINDNCAIVSPRDIRCWMCRFLLGAGGKTSEVSAGGLVLTLNDLRGVYE